MREATTAKRMKIDPYCQRQRCNQLKVLFNIMFLALTYRRLYRPGPSYMHCCRALTLALARLCCYYYYHYQCCQRRTRQRSTNAAYVLRRRGNSWHGEASTYQSTSARLYLPFVLGCCQTIVNRYTYDSIVDPLADSPSVDKFIQYRSYCTSATANTIILLRSLGRAAVAMDNSVLDTVVWTVSRQLGTVVVSCLDTSTSRQLVDNRQRRSQLTTTTSWTLHTLRVDQSQYSVCKRWDRLHCVPPKNMWLHFLQYL